MGGNLSGGKRVASGVYNMSDGANNITVSGLPFTPKWFRASGRTQQGGYALLGVVHVDPVSGASTGVAYPFTFVKCLQTGGRIEGTGTITFNTNGFTMAWATIPNGCDLNWTVTS